MGITTKCLSFWRWAWSIDAFNQSIKRGKPKSFNFCNAVERYLCLNSHTSECRWHSLTLKLIISTIAGFSFCAKLSSSFIIKSLYLDKQAVIILRKEVAELAIIVGLSPPGLGNFVWGPK